MTSEIACPLEQFTQLCVGREPHAKANRGERRHALLATLNGSLVSRALRNAEPAQIPRAD